MTNCEKTWCAPKTFSDSTRKEPRNPAEMSRCHWAQRWKRIGSLQMASTSIASTFEQKKPNLYQVSCNATSAKGLDTTFTNAKKLSPDAWDVAVTTGLQIAQCLEQVLSAQIAQKAMPLISKDARYTKRPKKMPEMQKPSKKHWNPPHMQQQSLLKQSHWSHTQFLPAWLNALVNWSLCLMSQ